MCGWVFGGILLAYYKAAWVVLDNGHENQGILLLLLQNE